MNSNITQKHSTVRPTRTGRRSGAVVIYGIIAMMVFIGFCSLAVDWGRVQLTRTELQAAADSAARAGAGQLGNSPAAAVAQAQWVASQNFAAGEKLDLSNAQDLQLGYWDTNTATFSRLIGGGQFQANAVRVVARRDASRGNALPLQFGQFFRQNTKDVSAESIAMYVPAINVDQDVKATAKPFLAGMPAGTVASLNNPHNSPDYAGTPDAPRQSPFAVNMPLVEGQSLTFDSIDGTARHDPNLAYYQPDGQLSDIGHNTNGAEHGIADTNAPINALVGLFLSDDQPDKTAAPAKLDFSTDASRNFQTLKPQLKQIFFIGDGLDSNGNHQNFVVPKGATRLFLATWDFYEWNNNLGDRIVKVNRPEQIVTVK